MRLSIVKSIVQLRKNGYSCRMLILGDLNTVHVLSQPKYMSVEVTLSQRADL